MNGGWWNNFLPVPPKAPRPSSNCYCPCHSSQLHYPAHTYTQPYPQYQHVQQQPLFPQSHNQQQFDFDPQANYDEDYDDEEPVFVMNEEWAARFAETEKKRAKRKLEKQRQSSKKGTINHTTESSSRPEEEGDKSRQAKQPYKAGIQLENPQQARQTRLVQLYGSEANTIGQLETEMQAWFFAGVDTYNPRLWPELPLS